MTDAEKVSTLRSAIERADKALDWILEQPGHSEWMMTTASRVRRILRAAIKKIDKGKDKSLTAAVRTAPLADTASSDKVAPGSAPARKGDDHVDS